MVISVNRRQFPLVVLGGGLLLFFVISYLGKQIRYTQNEYYDHFIYVDILTTTALLIVTTMFTILATWDYLNTLFNKTAVLTITDNGINDNLGIFSVGDVEWTDITEIKILNKLRKDFLVIYVKNPQAYITRVQRIKQWPLRSLKKKFGSPIVISQRKVDFNINDLKEILLTRIQKRTVL